jgi:predicted MFS family arabinose efflux permease
MGGMMETILGGFAACVFALVSIFAAYTYLTTPDTVRPQALPSPRARALFYWGLFVILGSCAAGVLAISWAAGKLVLKLLGGS